MFIDGSGWWLVFGDGYWLGDHGWWVVMMGVGGWWVVGSGLWSVGEYWCCGAWPGGWW